MIIREHIRLDVTKNFLFRLGNAEISWSCKQFEFVYLSFLEADISAFCCRSSFLSFLSQDSLFSFFVLFLVLLFVT